MINCIRCQRPGEPINTLPHKGALGEDIKSKICALCWEEWQKESVKIINEHHLKLNELAARNFLSTQMKIYLKLSPSPPDSIFVAVSSP